MFCKSHNEPLQHQQGSSPNHLLELLGRFKIGHPNDYGGCFTHEMCLRVGAKVTNGNGTQWNILKLYIW